MPNSLNYIPIILDDFVSKQGQIYHDIQEPNLVNKNKVKYISNILRSEATFWITFPPPSIGFPLC